MQNKKWSLFESICNTMSGLILAVFIWKYVVIPIYIKGLGLDMNNLSMLAVFGVNIIFTIVSVIRGFCWRRLFNGREQNVSATEE